MSINWTDKQNVVFLFIETLLNHKREWVTNSYYVMDELQKYTKLKSQK